MSGIAGVNACNFLLTFCHICWTWLSKQCLELIVITRSLMIDSPRSISEDLPPPTTPLPQKILIFREIELSRSSIEKFLIFSYFLFQEIETPKNVPYISGNGNRKNLLIFWEIKPLSPRLKKSKKSPPHLTKKKRKKNPYTSGKRNFKKLLIFSQKNVFLIFRETKMELPYISKSNSASSKKCLIFWKMELSAPQKIDKFL